jgi:CRISPR-associated protein Cmr6
LDAVVQLSQQPPQGVSYDALFQRRADTLRALNAQVFHCRTTAPLTLHLARASALENAGICLHPVYGFTFLVGTGLKGMTRAFAETVWFPSQYGADASGKPENEAEIRRATDAWHTIEAIFGWAPNSDAGKPWKPRAIPRGGNTECEHAGQIVFHDAWPTKWPRLIVDILNNHHADYYRGEDAPGDWENPVPVYFLAVEPGQTFELAIAKRRSDVPDALLDQARQWLLGALCHLGAGAKTNAGYGAFQPVEGPSPALVSPRHATFEATLELVTPAFLAGANQQAEDCDLRPATLRGLLRWWWRTMHAGFVDVATLRAMEAAIWGDTKSGGAVKVDVTPIATRQVGLYDKWAHANMSPEAKRGVHGIPGGNSQKTTQGLWYASFGMDETSRGQRRQRAFRSPGEQWNVRLICRGTANGLPANRVLEQAQAALWLLCHFGGAGSKSRKGFGSLTCRQLPFTSVQQCEQAAQGFRRETRQESAFRDQQAESPSLAQLLDVVESTFPWPNVWDVMDQVGFAYQAFAKQYAHRREKMAMGLPRHVGSRGTDVTGRFEPSGPVGQLYRDARQRRAEHNVRHASPIHIHVDR